MHRLPLGDWYAVGLKLGIPDTDLDNVEKENWGKPKDQIREMFGLWLKRDTKATYGKLIEVLLRRKETESAEQLAKQIGWYIPCMPMCSNTNLEFQFLLLLQELIFRLHPQTHQVQ